MSLRPYVWGRFVLGRFVPWEVLSRDVLSVHPMPRVWYFSLQNKTIPSAGHGGTGFKKQTLVGIKKSYKRLELAGMPGELGLTGTKL